MSSKRHLHVPTAVGLALALLSAALPAAAAGLVEVSWLQPERYSDAGRTDGERERTMKSLGDAFAQLGRLLPDGQTLKLEVLDVDLAGEIEPHPRQDMRIVRGGADWPRMTLRYTLQEGSRTLKSGEARLADMDYQFGVPPVNLREDELRYERRMIEHWFGQNFGAN